MNKLRITADDFGCTHSINEAIEILHKIGIVNYAAIMVQGDEIHEAIKIAKRNKRLSIGLHFTITDELSLSKRNSITDNNFNLFPRKKLLIRCSTLRIKKKDVEIELKNQIITYLNKISIRSHRTLVAVRYNFVVCPIDN